MILVTGAGGKTGRAVIDALRKTKQPVRAWVHRPDQGAELPVADFVAGDLQNANLWRQACEGVRALYHICPNVHPHETTIGALALQAARRAGVQHFVYHSVLHPQTQAMPHHWNKLRVEEWIFESGIGFTILQPAAYMQNVLAHWQRIVDDGVYPVPYPVESRLSVVDLDDVAHAAALVLTRPGHQGAIYELAGPAPLSQVEVAQSLALELDRPVTARELPLDEWEEQARRSGLSDYAVETLLAMFRYYARHGLIGSSNVLRWLIGHPPTTFADFVRRRREGGAA